MSDYWDKIKRANAEEDKQRRHESEHGAAWGLGVIDEHNRLQPTIDDLRSQLAAAHARVQQAEGEALALRQALDKFQADVVEADAEHDVKETYRLLRNIIYDLDDFHEVATPRAAALGAVVAAAQAWRDVRSIMAVDTAGRPTIIVPWETAYKTDMALLAAVDALRPVDAGSGATGSEEAGDATPTP